MSSITAQNGSPGGIVYYGDATGNLLLQGSNTVSIQVGTKVLTFLFPKVRQSKQQSVEQLCTLEPTSKNV